jgi:hypothetical protein
VVYLDYRVSATAGTSSGIVTISGFASNGTTQADFSLKNTVNQNASGVVLSLDYNLTVPSRGLSLDWTAMFANISATEVAVTLDLAISGPNGDVRIALRPVAQRLHRAARARELSRGITSSTRARPILGRPSYVTGGRFGRELGR